LDGLEEGRRNREIAGARIFAGVKKTADEGRRVVRAAKAPLADSTKERRRFLAKVILEKVNRYDPLIWHRVIQAEEILTTIEKGDLVKYDKVVVEGDLHICGLKLPTVPVERSNSELEDLRLAKEAKLITSSIIITKSEIQNAVNFEDVVFQNSVIFRGTKFIRDANFAEAHFESAPSFDSVQFRGGAHFPGVHFNGGASFIGTRFREYANFVKVKFRWGAVFKKAKFNSFAIFEGAEFDRGALFIETRFSGDANFLKAKFNGTLNLEKAKFDRLFANWNDIKNCLEGDITLYPTLIKNYNNRLFAIPCG